MKIPKTQIEQFLWQERLQLCNGSQFQAPNETGGCDVRRREPGIGLSFFLPSRLREGPGEGVDVLHPLRD
jgi:hypothetical protein